MGENLEISNDDEIDHWIDSIPTEMNACSLEVLRNYRSLNILENLEDLEEKSKLHPLIIGCYQLDESESSTAGNRDGQLRLYMVDEKARKNELSDLSFCNKSNLNLYSESIPEHICQTEAGVLDGKWLQRCPMTLSKISDDPDLKTNKRCHIFASASASGKIWLHLLNFDKQSSFCMEPFVSSSSSTDGTNDNRICLALDIDESNVNVDSGTGSIKIISSYSDGTLAIHTVVFPGTEGDVRIEEDVRWRAHSLFNGMAPAEVWTCCWAKTKNNEAYSNLVLSGGDDCKLKGWDVRLPMTPSKPIFQIGEEEHGAGVTALSWHPKNTNVFASGSYDEGVRIWDIRCMTSSADSSGWSGRPKMLAKIDSSGGGIWRLKWHPDEASKLLVGAMHGGCRVLNIPALESEANTQNNVGIDIIASFTAHKSMAYGADWLSTSTCRDDDSVVGVDVAASCSFYDQRSFLWKVN